MVSDDPEPLSAPFPVWESRSGSSPSISLTLGRVGPAPDPVSFLFLDSVASDQRHDFQVISGP